LRCEVCGIRIRGEPKKVIIEGAKMLVCGKCSSLGSVYLQPETKLSRPSYIPAKKANPFPATIPLIKREAPNLHEEMELVENFGSVIREAREKLGLSHEELGRKIGEKVSLIKKVENQKMVPDQRVAVKLEHVLRVKLLVLAKESKTPVPVSISPSASSGLTLGEIAYLKTGKRRHPENEGTTSS